MNGTADVLFCRQSLLLEVISKTFKLLLIRCLILLGFAVAPNPDSQEYAMHFAAGPLSRAIF
jgi:hypothetical protein